MVPNYPNGEMKKYGFSKDEKLKAKKDLDFLFKKGKWLNSDKLRMVFVSTEGNTKVGVSASKKLFKRAVDRNRIKRLLREAYRLNKDVLAENSEKGFYFMVFWVHSELPKNLEEVQQQYKKLGEKFQSKIQSLNSEN